MANGEGGGSSSSSSSRRTTPPPRSGPATPSGTPTRHTPMAHPSRKPLPVFNSYMSLFQVQEKLKKGEVIEGVLRINPKNYEDAYISAPDGGTDIYIGGVPDRNAALHGDVVAVELCPSQQWKVLYDVLDEYLENNPSQLPLLQLQHTNTNTNTTNTPASAVTIIAATTTTTTTTATTTITTTAAASRPAAKGTKLTTAEKLCSSVSCKGRLSSATVHTLSAAQGEALLQGDSDVLVEGEEEEEEKSKASKRRKKRGGRGKKKGKKKDEVEELTTHLPAMSLATPDHLVLLPSPHCTPPSRLAVERKGEEQEEEEDEDGGGGSDSGVGRAVPPDMLSECESSDNESGTSEVLDYEQCREDQAFFQAQWQAYYDSQGTQAPPGDSATAGPAQGSSSATEKGATEGDKAGTADKCTVSVSGGSVGEVNATVPQGKAAGDTEAQRGASAARRLARRKNKSGRKEVKDTAPGETTTAATPPQHHSSNQTPNRGRGGHTRQGSGTPQHRRGPQPHSTPKKPTQRTEPTVAQVSNLDNWERFVQRTGRVVYISERKHPRHAAGTLRPFPDRNPTHALFAPTDHRVPRMKVPYSQLPTDFLQRHSEMYQHKIFLCRIVLWAEPKYAMGEVVREVGNVGDIKAETEALLLEHGVETDDFPAEALKDLPILPWTIPEEELAIRTDLREQCIFTIDPETARDLDDALSCTELPGGDLRVGVHIADVTYFVREGSGLDSVAARRATSVYMPDRVVPMLPRPLCEGLCSLLPGTDRLAVSVVWQVSPAGQVTSEWFGRTVIRSCAKLNYEQAQQVIDSGGGSVEGLPAVEEPHSAAVVAGVVWRLHSLAQILRRKRFDGGALHLYQPKLCFTMDWSTGQTLDLAQPQGPDHSHHLVEELMLLANMAAAQRTHQAFPAQCVLRRHPPPLPGPMEAALRSLAAAGVVLDGSSAGALQASLAGQRGAVALAVAALCSKPMQFARYFAPGSEGSVTPAGAAHHYALNVALYTHFTSPIRRYADVMVHRLLAATLDPPAAVPRLAAARLGRTCEHCNDRKRAAKTVQEASGELHLGQLVRRVGELPQPAAVVQVLDRSFDAVLLRLGLVRRVYTDPLPLTTMAFTKQDGQGTLTLHWRPEGGRPATTQRITLLSTVEVVLRPADNTTLKFNTVLLRPE
ncbi:DIS3-like exonuclease 2 isoform X2 [Portunus trituberculatus]|nr:DIS3-like exonuclease 2 isoform X2 [Portunus trituberculatus]